MEMCALPHRPRRLDLRLLLQALTSPLCRPLAKAHRRIISATRHAHPNRMETQSLELRPLRMMHPPKRTQHPHRFLR